MKIEAGQSNCRHQAKDHACQRGDCEREEKHTPVDGNLVEPWHAGLAERPNSFQAHVGHHQAEETAKSRKHEALGKQLANDAPAAGAERGTNRDFSLSCERPRQQQVRHVRARN